MLVPLLSLGRRMDASAQGEPGRRAPSRSPLRTSLRAGSRFALCAWSAELFETAAMQSVGKDYMAMTVAELKEELAARDEAVSALRQQGVAAPVAPRRDHARASTSMRSAAE